MKKKDDSTDIEIGIPTKNADNKKTTKKVQSKKATGKKTEKLEVVEKVEVTEAEVKEDLKQADKVKAEKKTSAKAKKSEAKAETQPKSSGKNKLKNSEKKHSKKYRKAVELVEKDKIYSPEEGFKLAKSTSIVKFDAAVEIHIRLNVDPANADQQVRGSLVLPAGTGKTKKVCAIVSPEKEKEAKDAGADTVGGAEIIAKIEKGWLDFEVVVATPDMMPSLGKIGKILGTKGLMPNPKVGTVTNDIGKVIKDLKGGMIEYRVDKSGIVHAVIGRVSFSETDLKKNYDELVNTITKVRPSGVKGTYIKSIFLTTSMGPSIKIQ